MKSVLCVVVYTDYKYYCRHLYPRAYNDLEYQNKELLFVDDTIYPELTSYPTGDRIAAQGRAFGIAEATRRGFDYVLFLDVDLIPDKDMLQKLVDADAPFICGVMAGRGQNKLPIGHRYKDWTSKERIPITDPLDGRILDIDGLTAGCMLVHRSVFETCDYTGYKGIEHYPNRTTCDDEYYSITVKEKLGLTGKMHTGANSWHLHTDGYGYRCNEERQPFEMTKQNLKFRGVTYE